MPDTSYFVQERAPPLRGSFPFILPGSFYPELFSSFTLASCTDCCKGFKVFFDPREKSTGFPSHGKEQPAVTSVKNAEIVHDVGVPLPLVGSIRIPDYIAGKRDGDLVLRGKVKPLILRESGARKWKGYFPPGPHGVNAHPFDRFFQCVPDAGAGRWSFFLPKNCNRLYCFVRK